MGSPIFFSHMNMSIVHMLGVLVCFCPYISTQFINFFSALSYIAHSYSSTADPYANFNKIEFDLLSLLRAGASCPDL